MEWAKRLERLKDDKTVLEKNQSLHFFFFLLVSFIHSIYYFYYDRFGRTVQCVCTVCFYSRTLSGMNHLVRHYYYW